MSHRPHHHQHHPVGYNHPHIPSPYDESVSSSRILHFAPAAPPPPPPPLMLYQSEEMANVYDQQQRRGAYKLASERVEVEEYTRIRSVAGNPHHHSIVISPASTTSIFDDLDRKVLKSCSHFASKERISLMEPLQIDPNSTTAHSSNNRPFPLHPASRSPIAPLTTIFDAVKRDGQGGEDGEELHTREPSPNIRTVISIHEHEEEKRPSESDDSSSPKVLVMESVRDRQSGRPSESDDSALPADSSAGPSSLSPSSSCDGGGKATSDGPLTKPPPQHPQQQSPPPQRKFTLQSTPTRPQQKQQRQFLFEQIGYGRWSRARPTNNVPSTTQHQHQEERTQSADAPTKRIPLVGSHASTMHSTMATTTPDSSTSSRDISKGAPISGGMDQLIKQLTHLDTQTDTPPLLREKEMDHSFLKKPLMEGAIPNGNGEEPIKSIDPHQSINALLGEEGSSGAYEIVDVDLHRPYALPEGSIGLVLAEASNVKGAEHLVVQLMVDGSVAEKDGRLVKGDRLFFVQGQSTQNMNLAEAQELIERPVSKVSLIVGRLKESKEEEVVAIPTATTALAPRAFSKPSTSSTTSSLSSYPSSANGEASGPTFTGDPALETYSETPTLVILNKSDLGVGISLDGGRYSVFGDRPIIVKKIFDVGEAARSGQIAVGDEIRSIDGIRVDKLTRLEAFKTLRARPEGPIKFIIHKRILPGTSP